MSISRNFCNVNVAVNSEISTLCSCTAVFQKTLLEFFSWNQLFGNNVDLTGKNVDFSVKIVIIVIFSLFSSLLHFISCFHVNHEILFYEKDSVSAVANIAEKFPKNIDYYALLTWKFSKCSLGPKQCQFAHGLHELGNDGKWTNVFDHFLSQYDSQIQITLVSMFHSNFGGQIRISSAWEIFLKIIFLHLYSLPMKFSQPLWDHIHAQFWKPNTNSLIHCQNYYLWT